MMIPMMFMMLALTINANCVDIKYDIDTTKKITDYTTYYTTLSSGDIVIQVKSNLESFYSHSLQVIPDNGDVTTFSSEYIYAGTKTTLASKVKANLKFRLQYQTTYISSVDTLLEGTLCYPTETVPTITESESPTTTSTTTKPTSTTTKPTSTPKVTSSNSGATTDLPSNTSESSNTGKILGIAGGIIAALLGAGGLTYLCRNPQFKCFSKNTTHIHNNGNVDDHFVNVE